MSKVFKDLMGNIISVGDIIVVGGYSYSVYLAKVYKITDNSVCFRYFFGKIDQSGPYSWSRLPVSHEDLLEEPSGYRGWSSDNSNTRLLVLKKNNVINKLNKII